MKKQVLWPFVALSAFVCSCSPRVTTEVLLSRSAQNPDSVIVYEVGDFVPNSAEVVGNIAVRDRGTTTKCKYDYVLHLAKKRTAECGGNALLLTEHREPNVWVSTCHQIWGKMLYLEDRQVFYESYNPVMEQVAREEAERSADVYHEQKQVLTPRNVVKLNVGPSQITSRLETPIGSYKRKWGTDAQLSYEHFFLLFNLGVAVVFDHSVFSFGNVGSLKNDFLGAGLAWSALTRNFRWNIGVVMGYGHGDDSYVDQGGFAALAYYGVEYMLSKHVGLGIDVNGYSNRWKKPQGIILKKNEYYGLGRFNLLGGLRFYF